MSDGGVLLRGLLLCASSGLCCSALVPQANIHDAAVAGRRERAVGRAGGLQRAEGPLRAEQLRPEALADCGSLYLTASALREQLGEAIDDSVAPAATVLGHGYRWEHYVGV